jgi:two-component system response regulator AtoC
VDDLEPAGTTSDIAMDPDASNAFRIRILSTQLPDPAMRTLSTRIRQLAVDRVPVLIYGESGVGKEIVARSLHHFSNRATGPWVAINCGAIPAGLIETELFGHERGAFSGATVAKLGLLEAADGGTIFLDEIGELPLDLQSRLLRFLDDREIRRVGAVGPRPVDARVVAATNRDLVAAVREGRFRADLLFRLRVGQLTVPPLRERLGDIPVLAQLLLDQARAERGRSRVHLSLDALGVLIANPWPGNVRELKHAMEMVAITSTGSEVALSDLPENLLTAPELSDLAPRGRLALRKRSVRASRVSSRPFMPLAEEVALLEKTRMTQALEACSWIQVHAARLLKVPRRTFVTKMKLYGIRRA